MSMNLHPHPHPLPSRERGSVGRAHHLRSHGVPSPLVGEGQGEQPCLLSSGLRVRLPRFVLLDHRVEDGEQLTHARDDGDFEWFAVAT